MGLVYQRVFLIWVFFFEKRAQILFNRGKTKFPIPAGMGSFVIICENQYIFAKSLHLILVSEG